MTNIRYDGTRAFLPDEQESRKRLKVIRRDVKVRMGKAMDEKTKAKLTKNLEKARAARSKKKTNK